MPVERYLAELTLTFDVSDDLSLRIEPDLNYFQASQKKSNVSGFGIKFVLSLNR